jgi:hypothetical protein
MLGRSLRQFVRRGHARSRRMRFRPAVPASCGALLLVAAIGAATVPVQALAQTGGLVGASVKKYADGVLALMCFSVVPDLTSSFLSISSASTADTGIGMTQFAGGVTLDKSRPLYLEGGFAYSRYDPTFVFSQGQEEREIPTKWTSVSGTAGVGWDFAITDELVFRPIANFALGHVESDISLAGRLIGDKTGTDIAFLDNGRLNAYGYGASLMLDYELSREDYEIDVEWRYTHIRLRSFGSSSEAVQGSALARTAGLWARWRAPTGFTALQRPLRYVLEAAHSTYWGDNANILGFDNLTSLGVGLELDSSAHDVYVTRTRLVMRYAIGHNVSGFSIGLAMSF